MEKSKVILLLAILLVLLAGIASASDVPEDTLGADAPESIATDTPATVEVAVQKQATPEMDVQKNTVKSNERLQDEKTLKTASSYDVTTYQELHDALTNLDDESITVNIKDNIKLNGTIMLEDIDVVSPIQVTINGEGKTIDGDHKHYFMNIHSPLLEVTINNLTISNCTGAPSLVDGSQLTAGGAIRNYATLTVNNTRFEGNNAELYGGAIWNHDTLIVDNSEFNNNTVHADNLGSNNGVGQGGAIYGGFVIVNNTRFASNNAEGGGAIFIDYGNLTVDNTEFTGNHAENGGGAIYIGSTSTVTNTVFNNNTAEKLGGAINNGGTLIVDNTEFANNNAHGLYIEYDEIVGGYLMSGGYGGAISNAGTGNLTVNNTVFTGNHADNYGGAIDTTAYSNLTVTNTRFNNNHADWWGGAIYYTNASEPSGLGEFHPHEIGSYNITDTTFYKNTPANFIINQDNYIDLEENANYINVSNITIIVDGEEIYNGPLYIDGGNGPELIAYCEIPEGNHLVKLIVNGTNIINNEYILSDTIDVTYQGLIDVIEEATTDITIKLQDDVSYNVLETITLDKPGITITIDGNGQTINGMQKQVFHINSGSSLVLNNITITNGQADMGGAIYNEGTLTIINSTLSNNNATLGGAIENSYGNLTITGSTLENNIATSTVEDTFEAYARGGAISNLYGNVTITNTTINNNQATATGGDVTANAYAGAISNLYGNVTITDSTINNNKATATATGNWDVTANAFGGVIYNTGTLTVTDSTLENNQATATATSTEEYITVEANALGGTIYNDGGILTVNDTQFANNTASSGGAIYSFMGNLTVTDTQFANNAATSEGGAIYTDMDNLTINNTNLINNNAQFGGAIYNKEASLNCTNSTFDMNTPANYNINDEDHIQLNNTNNYIPEDATYAIYLDNEEECVYTGSLNGYTVPKNHVIRLVVNGSDTNVFGDNTFILYTYDRIVRNYTQLVEAVGDAKISLEEEYSIYLLPGDYNATANMTWGSVSGSTRKLIINGNGLTLDGINTYQFMKVEYHSTLILYNITITNYCGQGYGSAIDNTESTVIITDSNITHNTAKGEYENGRAITNLLGNISITNSNLSDNTAGAIYNNGGTVNITCSNILNNAATWRGSAIANDVGGIITIAESNFTNNAAKYGGAIFNNGGTIVITGSDFSYNNATIAGSVIANDEGTVNITTSNFTHNIAYSGGAIYNYANGVVNIIYSKFINDTANNGNGGAIYNNATMTINHTQLEYNNVIGGLGGAIYNLATLMISDAALSYNNASRGGAVYNNHASMTMSDSILENNTADNEGGAIYNENGIINVTGSIFTSNTAANASAISNYGSASIYNNTFKTNNANMDGTAIIDESQNAEIRDNINDEISVYPGTIYTKGEEVSIIRNIFDDGIIYTTMEINVNNTNPYLFDEVEISLLLKDHFNKTIPNQFINLEVGDKTYTVTTNTDGIATQKHTITSIVTDAIAVFTGNDEYNKTSNSTVINAQKLNTKLTLMTSNSTPLNNTQMTITITLTDAKNNKVSNQDILLNIAGINVTVKTNNNGSVTYKYTPTTLGKQTITATYKGNSHYNNSTKTTSITVKTGTILTLTVSNVTPVNSTPITITAILTDTNNNKLANRNITFTIDDKTYTTPTNNEGIATQTYTPTNPGKQTITAKYNGDSQHNSNTATATITVKKINTKLTVNTSNTTPINNTQVNITATLTDTNGNKLAGQNITITIAGKTYTVKTDNNGVAIKSYTPTTLGKQTITATYKGDSKYNNSTSNTSITVKKINTKLVVKASNTTPTLNTSISITATLTDTNGNKLSGQNVTITIAGKTYTVKTNSNGVATKAYTPTTVGKQTITLSYNGDSKYNNITNTTNITVNKINTKLALKVSNNTPKVSDTISITATLTDATGNKVAGQNITITVEDKTYTVKTNNNGIATQTHKLTRAGSTNITAKYNGNNNYNSSNTSTKITVKENMQNTSMTITVNNTTPRVNDNVMVTFTLKDEKNNPIKNQEIKATINGINTTVKTNNNGMATTNYTVAKKDKNITITATYNGNTTLKATTCNLSLDMYYKVDMELLTGSFDSKPGQTVKLIAHIKDNGVDIDGGQLVFKLNGVSLKDENGSAVIVNIKKGLAVLEYKIPDTLGARTHNLTAVYASNTYGRVELTTPMTIGKYTTHIDVNPLYTTTDKITIKAQIVDQNNQALNKQTTISIKVNGKSYSLNTINGTIDYTITQTLKDGYYNITIISGENGKYLGANVKTVLIKSNTTIKTNYINNTLNKDTTAKSGDTKTSNIMSILTGSSTVKPGDRLKLIAHLSEDQVDITGGQLVFKLNGVSLKDENGNAVVVNINNGLGVLDYKIPDTLGARTHNLTAVYSSKQYGRVELTTQLTMNRLNTHIEAEPIYTTGTTSYIKAKILDDNNQLINKQTSVVIKVDGKSYAFNTTTGSINYKVPNTLSKGLHQITIIAGENGKYISSRANTVLIKT
ncbi:MAG: Ig-like domain repeat protein [Methanosphaera sp.]|nr:Ig-like domain repeat protein [Methanosphaera sp.]